MPFDADARNKNEASKMRHWSITNRMDRARAIPEDDIDSTCWTSPGVNGKRKYLWQKQFQPKTFEFSPLEGSFSESQAIQQYRRLTRRRVFNSWLTPKIRSSSMDPIIDESIWSNPSADFTRELLQLRRQTHRPPNGGPTISRIQFENGQISAAFLQQEADDWRDNPFNPDNSLQQDE